MTVIVANREFMAGDTQASCQIYTITTSKVFAIGGNLVGAAGSSRYTEAFFGAINKYGPYEIPPDRRPSNDGEQEPEFDGLVVTPDRRILHFDCYFSLDEVLNDYCAVGGGAHGALAVLKYLGRHDNDAIIAACTAAAATHPGCGLPISGMTIEMAHAKQAARIPKKRTRTTK